MVFVGGNICKRFKAVDLKSVNFSKFERAITVLTPNYIVQHLSLMIL
jgi:hypothetical protein